MLLFPDRQTPSRSEHNDTQQHSNNAVKKWKHQCVTVVQHYRKEKRKRKKRKEKRNTWRMT